MQWDQRSCSTNIMSTFLHSTGFSHCRILRHSQIMAEHDCHISYPLLMELIHAASSSIPRDESTVAVSSSTTGCGVLISYEDCAGHKVVIASTDELHYAASLFDDDDMMTLKVELVEQTDKGLSIKDTDMTEAILEQISELLKNTEDQLTIKISHAVHEAEARIMAKLAALEAPLSYNPVADQYDEEVLESEEEVLEDDRSTKPESRTMVADQYEEEVLDDDQSTKTLETITEKPNLEGESENRGSGHLTSHDMTSTTSFHKARATDDRLADLTPSHQNNHADILRLLQTCVEQTQESKKATDRHEKTLMELKNDVHAQVDQLSEWHKTVLDGISVQTKVLKTNFRERIGLLVKRVTQLEAVCSDLQKNRDTKKDRRAWKRVEEGQATLRQDIGTLIKALVKEVEEANDNRDNGSDDSIASDDTDISTTHITNLASNGPGIPSNIIVHPKELLFAQILQKGRGKRTLSDL